MGSGGSEPPPPVKKPVESPSATPDYSVTQQRGVPRPDPTYNPANSLLDAEDETKHRNLVG